MQTHTQVIENFIRKGIGGKGTFVKAAGDVLYSRVPSTYRPFGQEPWGETAAGREAPLAIRLEDGSLLANGARFATPISGHQWQVLEALEQAHSRFGVVPFHSIAAAWTAGAADDWDNAHIPIPDLKAEIGIIVPSQGEPQGSDRQVGSRWHIHLAVATEHQQRDVFAGGVKDIVFRQTSDGFTSHKFVYAGWLMRPPVR